VTVAEAADRLTADLEAMAPALEGDGEEDDEAASAAAGSASVTGSGPLSSPYQLITAGSAPPADEGAVGTLRCAVVVSQPDASLLLCGLKRFIGSHWATHHRGRVWIVSGPEEASQAEIDASLAAYRQMLPGRDLPTPAAFPTGCVLGAVDLAETLAMQEYRSRVIDATAPREYSAPNLWRTERPHALRTPIAVPSLEVLSGGGGASASRPAATDKETPLKRLVLLPAATCATATGALEPADLAFRPVETLKPAAVSSSSSSSSVAASASSSESASASAAPASGLVAGGFDISTGTEVGVLSGAAGASVSEAMAGLRKALGSASRSLWPRPSRCEELAPGVVLLREMVPLKVQQAVVDAVRALGVSGGGFHTPTYGDGGAMRCKMMCLGHSWNPRFGEYETKRSHHDDAPVPPVPEAFTGLCQTALGLAKATSRSSVGSRETAQYQPSICLCNYYDPRATMGHHQDKHEADSALKAGSPVISVSIGCSAEFSFGNDHPDTAASRLKTVRLNSGDVLVFGGPGRHIFHGVDRILARTKPRGLKIGQGRLNLTFRELE
jgi:DNA alkylation damage repair protein AlkB